MKHEVKHARLNMSGWPRSCDVTAQVARVERLKEFEGSLVGEWIVDEAS